MWTSFEPTSVLYITPVDHALIQELLLQEHKQKLFKSCGCCKMDTSYVDSKHILQPPKYLIIIVNKFSYINNKINFIFFVPVRTPSLTSPPPPPPADDFYPRDNF